MTLKFYYINLKNSKDRKENMELFFKNLSNVVDINYQRIEAFDGRIENINKYLLDCKLNQLYSSLISERIQRKDVLLTNTEFGCLYSHFKVLHQFLQTDEPYCFVCEDDLDPDILQKDTKDLLKIKIKKIISKISKYGIISLSCVGRYDFIKVLLKDIIKTNKNKFISFKKYLFYGTGCYLIDRETAKKIINSYVKIKNGNLFLKFNGLKTSMVADNFIYMHANTKFYLPSLFYTRDYQSNINNNSNNMAKTQHIMKLNYVQNTDC